MDWDTAAKIASFVTPGLLLVVVHFVYRSSTIAQSIATNAQQSFERAASQANASASSAAVAVKEVETRLTQTSATADGKANHLTTLAEATHTLVNSNMAVQLKVSAVALRRVAELTKDPADEQAAALAEKAARDHDAKQRIVDAGDTTVPEKP